MVDDEEASKRLADAFTSSIVLLLIAPLFAVGIALVVPGAGGAFVGLAVALVAMGYPLVTALRGFRVSSPYTADRWKGWVGIGLGLLAGLLSGVGSFAVYAIGSMSMGHGRPLLVRGRPRVASVVRASAAWSDVSVSMDRGRGSFRGELAERIRRAATR